MNLSKSLFFVVLMISMLDSTDAQEWVSFQSPQQVNDLIDTGDELIMATDAGLVVINKSTLEKTIFNTSNSNLSNNHIQSIAQAPNGDTYIGTYDVIMGLFDGSDFQDFIMPEGDGFTPSTVLYDFEIAENGDFWVGTSDGVFHKQGQNWSHYDEDELGPDFFEAWDIEINGEGDVFVASFMIHKYVNGEWTNISDTTQLICYNDAALFFSESGDIYLAGDLDRIGRFDGTQWYEYDNGGLNGSEVIGFTEDANGTVYFNTQRDGIFKLENNTTTLQEDTQTSAFNNHTSYFHIDDQNKRWLNNNIYLSVNDNGNIQSTSIASHTIEYNNVNGIQKGLNGDMFFLMTTFSSSIAVVDTEGNWSTLQLPANLTLWPIRKDILFLANDDIWLAAYEGLYHYNGSAWILNALEPCNNFTMDSEGKIYVLSSDRIYIIDNGNISEYNTDNSPISDLILSGHGVDANDNLWVASFSWEGEAAIQKLAADGTWTTYSKDEHTVIDRPSGQFHFDSNGKVWVPSDIAGAIMFDGTIWSNPITENSSEIENINAYAIESDAEGKLYFAHQYGVTTLLDGEWGNLSIEEVPNNNSSFSSAIKFDNNGTLWWASSRYGVFSYSPESTTATFSSDVLNTGLSVYPNPAQDYTVIDFKIPDAAYVNVSIYNDLGQLQSNLDLGQLPAGTFQQTIKLSDFSTGIYSIQLKLDDRFFIQKIMVE